MWPPVKMSLTPLIYQVSKQSSESAEPTEQDTRRQAGLQLKEQDLRQLYCLPPGRHKLGGLTAWWGCAHITTYFPRVGFQTRNANSKECVHSYVHCSIIHNRRGLRAAQPLISRWVGKAVAHLHSGILLSCKKKKKGNLTFCNSMDGPGEHYSKWNKPVRKDKYQMISLICGIPWKK